MKKFLATTLICLTAMGSTFAEDTIVFKNGDVLTGTILKQDSEHVYFKSGAFGSVSLDTRNISEIKIDTPELGEVAIPAEAITTQEPEAVVAPQVARTAPTPPLQAEPKDKKQWAGQSGLAIALRESNTLRRSGDNLIESDEEYESYRIYGNVNWTGEKNNLRWNWTYRNSRSDLRKIDDFLNLTQNYQHDFTPKYYLSAKTIYERDFRRGIESEYLQTAEIGVKWFHRAKFQLSTSAGGGYHTYDRIQDKYSDAQGKFVVDQSLRWQMINSLTLFQKYSHLGNLDKYHFIFTSGLENKLIRDVFLRLEYRLDRDTEVNYADKGYYDKALLTSILYNF